MSKTKRIDNLIKATAKYHRDEDLQTMYKRVRQYAIDKGYQMHLVFRKMFQEFIEKHIEVEEGTDEGNSNQM